MESDYVESADDYEYVTIYIVSSENLGSVLMPFRACPSMSLYVTICVTVYVTMCLMLLGSHSVRHRFKVIVL